jgi:chemotaxis protein MotB
MRKLKAQACIVIALSFAAVSCVPLKQYKELQSDASKYKDNNDQLKGENQDYIVKNKELQGQLDQLTMKAVEMKQELEKLSKDKDAALSEKERLEKAKEELEQQINSLKKGSSEEITRLLGELQKLQDGLQEREDKVKAAEQKLQEQQQRLGDSEAALADEQQKLKVAEDSLAAQQAKLFELQDALSRQKNTVSELKQKVLNALKGYNDQGLTIHEKNGKVYVSMEDKLLFNSGSYTLGVNGKAALDKLSEVLSNNPDINIMVEGHTDNVPLTGSGALKDNWDLSVMRATAVTKIILANKKIDPKRIVAAGRSEYVPLDPANTPEARLKNRRTEIILTPNLDEVLKILEMN